MSNKTPGDQKYAERQAKLEKSHHRSEHFFRHVLHYVERTVATITGYYHRHTDRISDYIAKRQSAGKDR